MNQFRWHQALLEMPIKGQEPKIVQITDPHIFKSPDGCLLGLNTRDSLAAVLEDIQAYHQDADLILATGDISQDHSRESYDHFARQVSKLNIPVAWVPGNHDTAEYMADSFAVDGFISNKHIAIGQWHLVLLDSSVPNDVHGELGAVQLAFLEQALKTDVRPYAMTVLHHHPVDIGCDWLAPLGLHDRQDFLSMLYRFSSVKTLLWGHIHQEYEQLLNDIQFLATPSTSVQFKPGSSDFAAGEEGPGYRTMILGDDGQIRTEVHRINHIEFTVDYTVKGY